MLKRTVSHVAIFTARPPERNTGMVTVDLAGISLAKRLFPQADISLYTWGQMDKHGYQESELPYRHKDICRHFSDYVSADIRIIWGDFTLAAAHWQPDPEIWRDDSNTKPSVQDVVRMLFLTDQTDDVLHRTLIFGGTLITNNAEDYKDTVYRAAFESLFSRAGGVFLRDALSAARVAPFQAGRPTLGVDCAFTLRDEDLNALPGFQMSPARRGIGVFFGRSPKRLQLLSFARDVGRAVDRQARWIPWFWSNRTMRFASKMRGFEATNGFPTPGAILSQLSACEFVVTDTYHLCVNAWRLGIPAICLGQGAGSSLHSLSDKKKEILFEMYEAGRYYVFVEELRLMSGNSSTVTRVADALKDVESTRIVTQRLKAHVETTISRLELDCRKMA